MKLHQLRDFVSVAHSGGIRAASRELQLTQPALSKSIQSLEEELGTPLFERTARGSTLNAYGAAFLARAEAAIRELARGREELDQLRGATGGNVTMAASSVASLMFLSSALEHFRKQFPDAVVKVMEGTFPIIQRGIRDGTLDFAVGPMPASFAPDEFVVEQLFANTRCVVARRNHPLRSAQSLRELLDAKWIVTGAVGPRDAEFSEIFMQYGLRVPAISVRCESLIALLCLLASSDALAFLPTQWVESPLTQQILMQLQVNEPVEGPSTCIIRRPGMPLTPAAEALAMAFRREAEFYSRERNWQDAPLR
ncbi:LysR substrate-binding domain-containing protein [Pseudomonas thivervalensis]|uniref:LysR substrate-binding domain-containing protein n=1 Tax=Pseudomonas thivervalensis TaxID=86265 RepID=UPI00069D545A|nr:LysR substrate-binding domain-containing protein [Pseudomonas thivervalensis]